VSTTGTDAAARAWPREGVFVSTDATDVAIAPVSVSIVPSNVAIAPVSASIVVRIALPVVCNVLVAIAISVPDELQMPENITMSPLIAGEPAAMSILRRTLVVVVSRSSYRCRMSAPMIYSF
jgi:hypothetical protein